MAALLVAAGFAIDDAPLAARRDGWASRSAARTSPARCWRIPTTRSACADEGHDDVSFIPPT
jgi:hypothetical protein